MVYIIDAADRIIHMDDEGAKYAAEPDQAGLAPDRLLGQSLWSILHGIEVIHLYRLLVRRARRGVKIEFGFRVETGSGAQLRRMRMQLVGIDSVIFEVAPLPEKSVPEALESSADRPQKQTRPQDDKSVLLVVCSWCDRLKMPDATWVEVEGAVKQLGLFERESPPRMTHGVCGDCYKKMGSSLRRPDDRISAGCVDLATHVG